MGMRAYTVHAPPGDAAEDKVRLIKDGFSWPALFVPILWILWRRLWLTLVWYVAWNLALAWVGRLAGDAAATVLGLLGAVLLAMEANDIRRRSLAQKGWRETGLAQGRNVEEAEIRYFGDERREAAGALDRRDGPFWPNDDAPSPYGDESVLGLFPEPEPGTAR